MNLHTATFLSIFSIFVFTLTFGFTVGAQIKLTPPINPESKTECTNCGSELADAPDLGSAAFYAVLGGSTVTSTGATILSGNLGVSPGTAITGFPPGIVLGTTVAGTLAAAVAKADSLLAYTDLVSQVCDTDLTGVELGGLTLTPGVYCFDTSAQLTGILTLDAEGDPDAVFVFQTGSTFITAVGAEVILTNGTVACNVFYQVGSSATIGSLTELRGTIIALTSITLNNGANVFGRVIALNGAVTLDTNNVTRCNFATSAGSVTVGGRVTNGKGQGIGMTTVTMTDASGGVRTAITSPFGYYNFENVQAGQSVILEVKHKRYEFAEPTLVLSLNDDLFNADFTAN